jgi:phosphomannomutase
MNASIFKAYDVRGIYPTEIDETVVYASGIALATHLKTKTVAIGRDARSSSPLLFEALAKGITDAGCDVIDLGLLTTPMVYFAAWNIPEADAVISITASHNPPQYNGFKIALKGAVPVGEHTGLAAIRDSALALDPTAIAAIKSANVKGSVSTQNIREKYLAYFASFANFGDKKFKIVVDTANAMGVLELDLWRTFATIELVSLYDDIDHPFTAHEANPMKTETLDELRAEDLAVGADLGIAYDGDADRVGFVDEKGVIVPMDLMIGILAKEALKKHPGSTVFYDLRSSKAVKEVIEEQGGIAKEAPVGSPTIKHLMRETNGQSFFGGEGSGHYFFQENAYSEGGSLPALMILNRMASSGQTMSEITRDMQRYAHSGEINSEVRDKNRILAALQQRYADGTISLLDGVKIVYPTWWFNVRASNTEPLLRLNLEADTQILMEAKRDELLTIIRG